jgi:hypothetical protein
MSAPIVVTKLERHEGRRPYWTARVHAGGEHVEADNRYGSWQASKPGSGNGDTIRHELRPEVAAALQARLPRNERGRR